MIILIIDIILSQYEIIIEKWKDEGKAILLLDRLIEHLTAISKRKFMRMSNR